VGTRRRQNSERLPSLTPLAAQMEKLWQAELFAKVVQLDSLSFALSEQRQNG
jgi:hypothetical protein